MSASARNVTDEDGILDIRTWDRSELLYRNPRRNAQGGMTVYTNMKDKPWPGSTVVQTPARRCPWGCQKGQNEDGKKEDKYSIEICLDDVDTDPEVQGLRDFIDDYDDTIIDGASENCVQWFGKKIPREAIAELVRRNIRKSKNPQYADTIRLRVPYKDGRFTAKLYDLDENEISWDKCGPNCEIIPLITSKSIWFVNKMFGTTWEVDHAVLVKAGGSTTGYTKCAVKIPAALKRNRDNDGEDAADASLKRNRYDEGEASPKKSSTD
jgi:hypothetical protein